MEAIFQLAFRETYGMRGQLVLMTTYDYCPVRANFYLAQALADARQRLLWLGCFDHGRDRPRDPNFAFGPHSPGYYLANHK